MSDQQAPRALNRYETHDLSMILKERAKVLCLYAEQQGAKCLAEFEEKLAAVFPFDHAYPVLTHDR